MRWWRGPVMRWWWASNATYFVVAPLYLAVAQCVIGRCTAGTPMAALGMVVVFSLPVLAALSLLALPVLAWYARRVRARPALEGSDGLVVRNCLLLVPAIVLAPVLLVVGTRLAARPPGSIGLSSGLSSGEGHLLVMPFVVCFCNLVVPRFAVRALRRGAWPGDGP